LTFYPPYPALACGLQLVARSTKGLEIAVPVRPTLSFRYDVIDVITLNVLTLP
jgi:hypothetical protein